MNSPCVVWSNAIRPRLQSLASDRSGREGNKFHQENLGADVRAAKQHRRAGHITAGVTTGSPPPANTSIRLDECRPPSCETGT